MIWKHRVHLDRVWLTLACILWVSVAPGCRVVKAVKGLFLPSDRIELAGDDQIPAPIDSASTRGLEVRLWVVDDSQWSTARALYPYAQGETSGLDQSFEQWERWGFRFVRVPIDEVQGFLDGLRPVQPTNVQWLGEFGQWRAVVRAGELDRTRVRVGDHSQVIEQGRPRLIARSWVEPMLSVDDVVPGVRLDLAMQIETRKQSGVSLTYQVDRERMIEDEGPVLDELLFSSVLDGSYALVLVGETPGLDWGALPPLGGFDDAPADQESGVVGPREAFDASDPEASQSGTQSQGDQSGPGHSKGEPSKVSSKSFSKAPSKALAMGGVVRQNLGPLEPDGQSLGELMFTSGESRFTRVDARRASPKRVVVVFLPRVEGGYGLIPRVARGADVHEGGAR